MSDRITDKELDELERRADRYCDRGLSDLIRRLFAELRERRAGDATAPPAAGP